MSPVVLEPLFNSLPNHAQFGMNSRRACDKKFLSRYTSNDLAQQNKNFRNKLHFFTKFPQLIQL